MSTYGIGETDLTKLDTHQYPTIVEKDRKRKINARGTAILLLTWYCSTATPKA